MSKHLSDLVTDCTEWEKVQDDCYLSGWGSELVITFLKEISCVRKVSSELIDQKSFRFKKHQHQKANEAVTDFFIQGNYVM